MTAARPDDDIAGLLASHRSLLDDVRGTVTGDEVARRPSRLPDWSVGHVLTHLARNGDAMSRLVDGAAHGEEPAMYVGGPAGRAAAIEDGAGRTAFALLEDLGASIARLEVALETMPDGAWGNRAHISGTTVPAADLPRRRWIEVEVHRVDLGLGYEPSAWPTAFSQRQVDVLLPSLPDLLPDVVDPPDTAAHPSWAIAAWLLGRGTPDGLPEIDPWA